MDIATDTRIVRDLGYDGNDERFEALVAVAKAGHRFHLCDHAVVEIVAALERAERSDGGFQWANWERARDRAAAYIDETDPIMLGGSEFFAGLGLPAGRVADPNKVQGRRDEARALWEILKTARSLEDLRQPRRVSVAGKVFLMGLKRGEASALLEEIRRGWLEDITNVVESKGTIVDGDAKPDFEVLFAGTARGMDSQAGWGDPPFSKRLDAQLRTRVYLHTRSLADGTDHYDATSKKKKNDGIDLDMLQYLAAPMLICVEDEKFTNAVKSAGSYQREWMLTPLELAAACKNGTLPSLPDWSGGRTATPR